MNGKPSGRERTGQEVKEEVENLYARGKVLSDKYSNHRCAYRKFQKAIALVKEHSEFFEKDLLKSLEIIEKREKDFVELGAGQVYPREVLPKKT